MTNDIKIETDRLQLRSWRDDDVDTYNGACNTPAVMRWLGGVQSRDELDQDVEYFMEEEARHGHTFWVVERKADKAFLGFCGLIRIPDRDCPCLGRLEIGWRIRQSAWRNGFAFEAADAVLDFAFTHLCSEGVVSRAAGGNVASLGLMAKLGLRHEPSLDYVPDGEIEPLRTYIITQAAWRARNGSVADSTHCKNHESS